MTQSGRSQKRPAWMTCPPPKTSVQKMKYVNVCSDYLTKTMKDARKNDTQTHINTVNHTLPAVLYHRSSKGPAETTTVSLVHLQDMSMATWGYHSTVAISCANCKDPLKSGKFSRHSLVMPHSPRAFIPLCRKCVKS